MTPEAIARSYDTSIIARRWLGMTRRARSSSTLPARIRESDVRSFALSFGFRIVEVNPLFLGGVPAGIVAAASKTRQRLGDMAANTFVLKQEHLRLLGSGNVEVLPSALVPRSRSKWAVAAGYLAGILGVRDLKQHPDRSGMAGAIFEIVMGVLGTAVIVLAVVSSHF